MACRLNGERPPTWRPFSGRLTVGLWFDVNRADAHRFGFPPWFRPVPADGGRAGARAAGRGRLAVRAEVGRVSRRARERRRRARVVVAERAPAAAVLPRAAAARRPAAATLGARRR